MAKVRAQGTNPPPLSLMPTESMLSIPAHPCRLSSSPFPWLASSTCMPCPFQAACPFPYWHGIQVSAASQHEANCTAHWQFLWQLATKHAPMLVYLLQSLQLAQKDDNAAFTRKRTCKAVWRDNQKCKTRNFFFWKR